MAELDDQLLAARVRIMQIIAYALIMGVSLFLIAAWYIVYVEHHGEGLAPPRDLPIFSITAFMMLVLCGIASIVVPLLVMKNNLQRIAADSKDSRADAAKLVALRQVTLIVGLALLEAPAFMGVIAFMQEAQLYVIAVPAVALVAMLLRIPTEGSMREWLAQQERLLNEMRATQG